MTWTKRISADAFRSISVCFILVLSLVLSSNLLAQDSLDRRPIVEFLLSHAAAGTADWRQLADKACMVPPDSGRTLAPRLFPELQLIYKEDYESEGLWDLLLANDASRTVRLIRMRQDEIEWRYDEDALVSELVACEPLVDLRPSGVNRALIIPRYARN